MTEDFISIPPPLAARDCLFMDLDGTLLALCDDPRRVAAEPALSGLLQRCAAQLDGAIAIISGRPLTVIDAFLAPARFAAAGLHGLERRDFSGMTHSASIDRGPLQEAALQMARAMEDLPMTILEDKGATLALHWRQAPEHESALRCLAQRAAAQLGPSYRLLEGNCVIEVLPRLATKGDAIRAFLHEVPFQGRRPVAVGDDITDLSAFAAVKESGGISIAVGHRVSGDFRLADVDAVHAWLAGGARG